MAKFSDRSLKALKPKEKRYELLEGDGFTVRVSPSGVKTFYYLYKHEGKNRRLKLGEYPLISLSEAREAHRQAMATRARGIDPVSEKKAEKAKSFTIEQLADYYIEKHARPNKSSWKKDRYILDKDVVPLWGEMKAEEIRRRDVILLLEGIVERGSPNQSNQVFKIVRRMFNFAVERGVLEATPCHLVRPLSPNKSKERALSSAEVASFWNILDTTKMAEETKRGLRMILVSGQRPGEVFGMHRREIQGKWWVIPPERAKNKRKHRIYITPLMRALIGEGKEEYVFGEMQKDAPARAVRRLWQGKDPRLPLDPFTPHDLRRTCATHLGEMGYSNEQIGRLLNHTDSSITGIYNRHRYDELKREMLLLWQRKLEGILKRRSPRRKVPGAS